mmetsp:Transcript_4274/g.9522  ORF Transcript_4274/g.9522 Transcript_4274/m.9522 type:complete len:135 (-) Transcript_4274:252-656(-)
MLKLLSVFALSFLVPSSVAQEFRHQRRIPQRPDRPSVREMVIKKYEMREEVLKQALKHREQALADHKSGRKLMSDEEHVRHLQQVKGIHRKLAGIRNKDKAIRDLEIESEIERHQRMMEGEFYWTHDGLVLKDH